jgi:hypothetical protein
MAQWIVSTTEVPTGKDKEADWRERGAYSKHGDALKAAKALRRSSPPRVRVRAKIDHSRGGMTG